MHPQAGIVWCIVAAAMSAAATVPSGMRLCKLSDLQTGANVQRVFGRAQPTDSGGFAVKVGDSIFILNSHENVDEPAAFALDLGDEAIRRVKGEIHPLNCLIGRREGDGRFWFQCNSYSPLPGTDQRTFSLPCRNTAVTFECSREPNVTVSPSVALVRSRWDRGRGELHLEFRHDAGAVEFDVKLR